MYKKLRNDFTKLVAERFKEGEKEYGKDAFLEHDTFKEIYEELADVCNWAMFTYIKLRIMEKRANAVRTDSPTEDARGDTGGAVSDVFGPHVPEV